MSEHTTVAPVPEQVQVEYRDVPGFPGYRINSDGMVETRKARSGFGLWVNSSPWRPVAGYWDRDGYKKVLLRVPGKKKRQPFQVHRLVLTLFISPCPEGCEAAHNNGIRDDNRLENLRWDTPAGNRADKVKHGTDQIGERHPGHKLTEAAVRDIRKRHAAGTSKMAIARVYSVSAYAVYAVVTGRTWKHLI